MRPGALMPFTASHSLEHGELSGAVFNARVIDRSLAFVLADNWVTQARTVELDGARLFASATRWGQTEIIDVGDGIVAITLQMGRADASVASASQGLRVLVLVTTNEEIRKLHPAVARPGRCAADVEFSSLTEAEAAAWLEAHGGAAETSQSRTLAELYALLEGAPEPKPSEPFAAQPRQDLPDEGKEI